MSHTKDAIRRVVRTRRAARGAGAAISLVAFALACGRPGADPVVEVLDSGLFADGQSADPALAVDPVTGDFLMAWVAQWGTAAAEPAGMPAPAGAAEDENGRHAAGEAPWSLMFARSADGGNTFSTPSRVNDVPGDVVPHAEGAPRLVAAPGVLALSWNNKLEAEGRLHGGSDIRFSRSLDGGVTWSPARSLQGPLEIPGMPPRTHTFHGAGWAGDSTLVVAWIDYREQDRNRIERGLAAGFALEDVLRRLSDFADPDDPHEVDGIVYAAISRDLGATWESPNTRIRDRTCNCCRISLARTPEGSLVGTWRMHFDGSIRDPVMHVVMNPDGTVGDSFTRVHEDGWVFPGCPHSGPGLDVGEDGTVHVAWYTGAEGRMGVHYARKSAGAEQFAPPVPIVTGEAIPVASLAVVALRGGGAVVAHNVAADGRRVLRLTGVDADGSVFFSREVPGTDGATHPQLARLPDGRIIVAWTESHDGVQRVRLARLTLRDQRVATSSS